MASQNEIDKANVFCALLQVVEHSRAAEDRYYRNACRQSFCASGQQNPRNTLQKIKVDGDLLKNITSHLLAFAHSQDTINNGVKVLAFLCKDNAHTCKIYSREILIIAGWCLALVRNRKYDGSKANAITDAFLLLEETLYSFPRHSITSSVDLPSQLCRGLMNVLDRMSIDDPNEYMYVGISWLFSVVDIFGIHAHESYIHYENSIPILVKALDSIEDIHVEVLEMGAFLLCLFQLKRFRDLHYVLYRDATDSIRRIVNLTNSSYAAGFLRYQQIYQATGENGIDSKYHLSEEKKEIESSKKRKRFCEYNGMLECTCGEHEPS